MTLWNTATRTKMDRLSIDEGNATVNGVAFSPDGKALAAGDTDGNLTVWNPVTRSRIGHALRAGSTIQSVAFSPNGKIVAAGDNAGNVVFWNPFTGSNWARSG